jgi:tetratricopeptide (TPR) repeat protein
MIRRIAIVLLVLTFGRRDAACSAAETVAFRNAGVPPAEQGASSLPTPLDWPATVTRVSAAVPIADHAELRALRDELTQAAATELPPREEFLVRYTLGYIERSLAFANDTPDAQQRELIEDAARQLERAVALEPKSADAHALLGSILGASAGIIRERAAEFGRRGRASLVLAAELEPFNPRVQVLLGSSALYRPPEFGGGADKAEPHLRRAIALFANEPKSKPWPNWGRFEAHFLLGTALRRLDRGAAAREQYELALALAPRSEYVRSLLKKAAK